MKPTKRFSARALVVLVAAVTVVGLMLATGASATTINTDVTPNYATHSTYDLTNHWTIQKSVDNSTLTLSPGQSATVTYSVAVTDTQTASNLHILDAMIATSKVNPFTVAGGQIDVTPSGSMTPVATVVLNCPNFGLVTPPGQQWNCNSDPFVLDWDATVPSLGSYTVTGSLHLADGSDAVTSKTADFTTATGLLVGQPRVFGPTSVDVTDSYAGDLGTVTAPSSQTFTYQRTITAPAGACSDFTVNNTASLTDHATGASLGSSSAAVTVDVQCNNICTASATGVTSIASNFNGTAIAAGRSIWFNSVLKPSGINTSKTTTLSFTGQTITFASGGTTYSVPVPDATIIYSPTATTATTTLSGGRWVTTVPSTYSGNVFLAGVPFTSPGLAGGANPVTWSGVISSSDAAVKVNWQWAAAVYTQFGTADMVAVKPVDANNLSAYLNSDHAGTPENFKPYVIGGARGGGGSNFTGSYSGTGHCP